MLRQPAALTALFAAGAALIALAAVPALAGVTGIPGKMFFAKNATTAPLNCAVKLDEKDWSPDFTVAAGGEIAMRAPAADSRLSLKCKRPADGATYILEPGERYAFLPAKSGKVMLRHVDI